MLALSAYMLAARINSPGTRVTASVDKNETLDMVLYFLSEDGAGLKPEERRLPATADRAGRIRQAVLELIKGPAGKGLLPVVPNGTALREAYFIEKEGRAYIDLSSDVSSRHWGGTTAEECTIYAIVNTVLKNFVDVKSVQFLIDGEVRETLAGHLDLRGPFRLKESLFAVARREAADEEMP